MRPEIDNLFLMQTKDAKNLAGHQQSEMRKRTQGAIADHDIALVEVGMQAVDARHVVRAQRRGQQVQQEASARMKQSQQMHDREAATGLLRARLTEGFLQS